MTELVNKLKMVEVNEKLSDAEKRKRLAADPQLKAALEYIQLLMDTSGFPGGPTGVLETDVRRGLMGLKDIVDGRDSSPTFPAYFFSHENDQ